MERTAQRRRLAELARVGKAVGDPSRLALLELLAVGEATVEALAQAAGVSPNNASRHLRILREAGLVEAEKQGIHVVYRLADPEVSALTRSLRILAERRAG